MASFSSGSSGGVPGAPRPRRTRHTLEMGSYEIPSGIRMSLISAMGSSTGTSNSAMNEMDPIRKTLFQSPATEEDNTSDATETSKVMSRLQIEHDVEASLRSLQRDLHEQRLKQLRQLQKDITEDDWQYQPIEKIIGLQ